MMANLGELKVPITYEMTDTGKQVLRAHVTELLAEIVTESLDKVMRSEVYRVIREPETAGILADAIAKRMVANIRLRSGSRLGDV